MVEIETYITCSSNHFIAGDDRRWIMSLLYMDMTLYHNKKYATIFYEHVLTIINITILLLQSVVHKIVAHYA